VTAPSAGLRGGLAGGAARGAAWNLLTFGLSKGVLLVTTIVLARILRPEDFGLLALALVVILYLDVLGDIGVGAAVIFRPERTVESAQRTASTAVSLAAATGLLLTGATVLAAPAVARLFDEPELTGVVRVIALAFLLRMLGTVHRSKLEKDMQFARRVVPEVTGTVVKGGLSIGLALGGLGVYSLAWGQVAGALTTTCLYWLLAGWRYRPAFDRSVVRDLLRFGIPVTLLGLLSAVSQTLDQLIIGARLDAEALGQYAIAYRLPELFLLHFVFLVSGSLFPAYARASDAPDVLRRGFRSALRMVSLVTVPVGLGLALVAADLVPVLFGPQWDRAVPVAQLLAITAMLRTLSFNVGDVYKAVGRVGVLNRLAVLNIVVTAPVLWLLAPGGIVAVAAGLLALAGAMTVLRFAVASRLMAVPVRDLLRDLLPATAAGAGMSLAVLVATALLQDLPAAARLLALVVVGALSYVAVLFLTSRSTLSQVLSVAQAAAGRRPADPGGGATTSSDPAAGASVDR